MHGGQSRLRAVLLLLCGAVRSALVAPVARAVDMHRIVAALRAPAPLLADSAPKRALRPQPRQKGKLSRSTIKIGGRQVSTSQIKVAVLGGGSFGTAMACVLGRKGVRVTMIVRRPNVRTALGPHMHAHARAPNTHEAMRDVGGGDDQREADQSDLPDRPPPANDCQRYRRRRRRVRRR